MSRKNYSHLTKEYLYEEYISKNRGTYDIADEHGCKSTTIRDRLIKFEIPIRKSQVDYPQLTK